MLTEGELIKLTEMLDALHKCDFEMDGLWHAAHDLAQAHEGKPEFDWLHALCHRIEEDHANAAYWYRKAGREPFEGSFTDEVRAMLAELKDKEY